LKQSFPNHATKHDADKSNAIEVNGYFHLHHPGICIVALLFFPNLSRQNDGAMEPDAPT